MLYQMSYFRWSFYKHIKELEGCKNKKGTLLKKIFESLICTLECIKCFPALLLRVSQTACYKAYSSHPKQMLQYRLPADKIKKLKKKPNYEQSLCPVPSRAPLCIPADNSYEVICGAKISVQHLNQAYFINCE